MAATTVNNVMNDPKHLSSIPYTGCKTHIVSLLDVDIPETATEEGYRTVYERYTQQSSSQKTNANAILLRDAIESIKYGIAPPVAFPTETVYGLGADATNEPAICGIFAAKGRPSDNPLIVHVASVSHLQRVTGTPLPEVYQAVVERFWPGPLTILLPVPASGIFAKNVHPAQKTIGFRIPSSKYARFFIAATNKPIAGPSANSSGKPSPTTARHVLGDLNGKINFILDGGDCEVGVESTVVDGLHDPPLVLRPGGVSLGEFIALGKVIGGEVGEKWARTTIGYKVQHSGDERHNVNGHSSITFHNNTLNAHEANGNNGYDEDMDGAPRAPGMKYRHYAPKGNLVLFSDAAVRAGRVMEKLADISRTEQSGLLLAEADANAPTVRVGIISCRWPAFAGLLDDSTTTSMLRRPSKVLDEGCMGKPFDMVSESAYAEMTSTATVQHGQTKITLFDVHLGPDISPLAHSLFGVLRLFDELGCAYIFAEMVPRNQAVGSRSSGESRRDLEEAVIDRIEKAATERVE